MNTTLAPSVQSPVSFGFRKISRCRAAFTLLEIMLVVMIIALLAGSAIYYMRNNVEIAKNVRVRQDIENLKTQLQIYETLNGAYPSTEQGLSALVVRPEGEPQPRRWSQIMTEVPLDPWNTAYALTTPAVRSRTDAYDVYSCARDRLPNTPDDIGNF